MSNTIITIFIIALSVSFVYFAYTMWFLFKQETAKKLMKKTLENNERKF